MEYRCGKDNAIMDEVSDIRLVYNEMELPEADGLRCPVCKEQYLLEEVVTTELNDAETMMESK